LDILWGFQKLMDIQSNNTEIWKVGNNAGGRQDANPKQISCDVSELFCKAYIKGYL
jgi:hypothetical protein